MPFSPASAPLSSTTIRGVPRWSLTNHLTSAPPDECPTPRFQCSGWNKEVYCWEDDENQMSVCVCVDTIAIGPGPVVGPVINSWEFVKRASR